MLNHAVNRFIDRQRWLEPVADFLQKVVGGFYKVLGAPGHGLKTFIHGTWLGHPLHPVITDIPLGAWTLAVLFDIIYLFNRTTTWTTAADLSIIIGVVAALAAAVTGYTDWNETIDRERRVGVAHGLINTLMLIIYVASPDRLRAGDLRRLPRWRDGVLHWDRGQSSRLAGRAGKVHQGAAGGADDRGNADQGDGR